MGCQAMEDLAPGAALPVRSSQARLASRSGREIHWPYKHMARPPAPPREPLKDIKGTCTS
jgi:hypothetical protein